MARSHARLLVTIWDDPDWRRLTTLQQLVYLSVLSSRDLSWCGVAPMLPQRLAHLAVDLTERKTRGALDDLHAARFLVNDHSTAEIAVRSYVRHDDLIKQPNVVKAMIKDFAKVHSQAIRDAIVVELARHYREHPDLKGWATVKVLAKPLYEAIAEGVK
jgi:hypothetical protein